MKVNTQQRGLFAVTYHFVPPLHLKTGACGSYSDSNEDQPGHHVYSDYDARNLLASDFGILSPEQMSDEQRNQAIAAGWCERCLEFGFDDVSQLRDPALVGMREKYEQQLLSSQVKA